MLLFSAARFFGGNSSGIGRTNSCWDDDLTTATSTSETDNADEDEYEGAIVKTLTPEEDDETASKLIDVELERVRSSSSSSATTDSNSTQKVRVQSDDEVIRGNQSPPVLAVEQPMPEDADKRRERNTLRRIMSARALRRRRGSQGNKANSESVSTTRDISDASSSSSSSVLRRVHHSRSKSDSMFSRSRLDRPSPFLKRRSTESASFRQDGMGDGTQAGVPGRNHHSMLHEAWKHLFRRKGNQAASHQHTVSQPVFPLAQNSAASALISPTRPVSQVLPGAFGGGRRKSFGRASLPTSEDEQSKPPQRRNSLSPPTPFEDIRDETFPAHSNAPLQRGSHGARRSLNMEMFSPSISVKPAASVSELSAPPASQKPDAEPTTALDEPQDQSPDEAMVTDVCLFTKLDDDVVEQAFNARLAGEQTAPEQPKPGRATHLSAGDATPYPRKRSTSNLSIVLSPNVGAQEDAVSPRSTRRFIVKVFVHVDDMKPSPMPLRYAKSNDRHPSQRQSHKVSLLLSGKATGDEMVQAALRQYQKQTGSTVPYDPSMFKIHAADSDGSVDTDLPALDRTASIKQLGHDSFVLVLDRTNIQRAISVNGVSLADRTRLAIDLIIKGDRIVGVEEYIDIGEVDREEYLREDIGGSPHRVEVRKLKRQPKTVASRNWYLEDVYLTVYIPEALHPSIVPVAPDVMLKQLHKMLCARFQLDSEMHVLKFLVGEGHSIFLPDQIRHHAAQQLKATSIVLEYKYQRRPRTDNSAVPEPPLGFGRYSSISSDMSDWSEEVTIPVNEISYREYQVIKTNRYGMRRERVLGLDSRKLFNKLPDSGAVGFFGLRRKTTQFPERPISSITGLHTDPSKPLCFDVSFEDGQTLYWEAMTMTEFREITGTLRQLLRFYQQQKRRRSRVQTRLMDFVMGSP